MKYFFGILTIMLFIGKANGQQSRLEGQIFTGPSIVSLRGNVMLDTLHKPWLGFTSGMNLTRAFNKTWSAQMGLAFERRGSVAYTPFNNEHGTYIGQRTSILRFEYLTLPLSVRAELFNGKLYGRFGIYAGYLLHGKIIVRALGSYQEVKGDWTSYYHRWDYGLNAGIGTRCNLKESWLLRFELQNALGLRNLSTGPVVNDGVIKTNAFSVLIVVAKQFRNSDPSH